MCDYFSQRMEGDHHHQAGDLADIVRAGGVGLAELPSTDTEWHLSAEPGTLFPPPQPSSSDGAGPSGGDGFANALAGLPDPFGMSDYRASSGGGAADFFDFEAPAIGGRGGGGGRASSALVDSGGGGVMMMPRATQMPMLSPREIRPHPGIMTGDTAVKLGMPAMMSGLTVVPPCGFDAVGGLHQMPSPRGGGGGIKRRFGTP
jgi:hypothetical protein